jgi:hypothetical protein
MSILLLVLVVSIAVGRAQREERAIGLHLVDDLRTGDALER